MQLTSSKFCVILFGIRACLFTWFAALQAGLLLSTATVRYYPSVVRLHADGLPISLDLESRRCDLEKANSGVLGRAPSGEQVRGTRQLAQRRPGSAVSVAAEPASVDLSVCRAAGLSGRRAVLSRDSAGARCSRAAPLCEAVFAATGDGLHRATWMLVPEDGPRAHDAAVCKLRGC